jgi:hypothetical protein
LLDFRIYLSEVPAGEYAELNERVSFEGVTYLNNGSAAAWPDCSTFGFKNHPDSFLLSCDVSPETVASSYLGMVATAGFRCSGDGSLTLVNGVTHTEVYSAYLLSAEAEPEHETLTINCVAATATPTNTPQPPSLGGVASYPGTPSHGPGLWTALAAATALAALATAAVARRRFIAQPRR